jgi:lysophospholipase L1-like esterase
VFAAEKLLSLTHPTFATSGIQRYIRLKEHQPRGVGYVAPNTAYQDAVSDSFKKQYHLRIDGDGFIYPSKLHDSPDLSIVFLGGSTTESMFVDEDRRFAYLVGRLLERPTRKVNSYNGGVSGNHSMHSIDSLLNKVLPMHPDIVVLMHAINDLTILLYEGSYWNHNPYRSLIVTQTRSTQIFGAAKALKDYLVPNLYMALKTALRLGSDDEFAHIRHRKFNVPDMTSLVQKFEQSLRIFVHVCVVANVSPVLMTQANRITKDPDPSLAREINRAAADLGLDYDRYRELYSAFNEAIRNVANEEGILLIDLAQLIPPKPEYIYDTVHLSKEGSRLTADIITSELQTYVMNSRYGLTTSLSVDTNQ